MIEFEQEVELDVSLEVLQFVGIADHTQLHNRDVADQHTMSAITGLDGKLDEIDSTLEGFALQLEADSEKLTSHDESLEAHTKELDTQKASIESLQKFSENIATQENTQEVLNDGE